MSLSSYSHRRGCRAIYDKIISRRSDGEQEQYLLPPLESGLKFFFYGNASY